MKIMELKAENIKKLKVVEIRPKDSTVIISGRNEQGKSSVLDSIWYALGGAEAMKDTHKPIREGESSAKVILDLGEIIVTRKWTADDKSYLTVENKDGATFKSPQAILDKLIGNLSFDPLAFSHIEEKRQAEILRQLVGIDFSGLDMKRKELHDERQAVNRSVRDIEGRLRNMPEVEAPDEEIDIMALSGLYTNAVNCQKENDEKRSKIVEMRVYITNLKAEIEALEKELEIKKDSLHRIEGEASDLRREVERLKDPDISGISGKLQTAEATNRLVRQANEREKVLHDLLEQKNSADQLSQIIQQIDDEKERLLFSAKFPVPGLSFNEVGVTYKGIPFSQCSTAERLRVSLAMAMAMNPKLKVLRIMDGSLLDSENMKVIQEMVAANDYQCWVEKVDETGKVGIYIEDGEVKA